MDEFVMVDRGTLGRVLTELLTYDRKELAEEIGAILDATKPDAEPVGYLFFKSCCRAPDDCEDYEEYVSLEDVNPEELAQYQKHDMVMPLYAAQPPAVAVQVECENCKHLEQQCEMLNAAGMRLEKEIKLVRQESISIAVAAQRMLENPAQPAPVPTFEQMPTAADADQWGRVLWWVADPGLWKLWRWDDPDMLYPSEVTHFMRVPPDPTSPHSPDSDA